MGKDQVSKMLGRFGVEEGDRPRVEWENFSTTARASHEQFACVYNPDSNTVHLNFEFPAFQEAMNHFAGKFPQLDDEDVEDAVQVVYEEEMVTRIVMAEALADELGWDDEAVDRMLSPAALTFAALGIVSESNRIATRLGGLLGSR